MPWAVVAAMAAGGAVAGAEPDRASSRSVSGVNLLPESEQERTASLRIKQYFQSLGELTNAGAGKEDVAAATASQRSLADILKSYSTGGFQPTAADTTAASNLANQLFEPAFRQQNVEADRLSARLGRPVNDPIIQARLRQGQADTTGQFTAQYAQNLPFQRLGFAQQLASVQGDLASQAFANRQAMVQLGSQIQGQERQWRLGTSERYSNTETASGGGTKGGIQGFMAGAGSGMSMIGGMGGMGGGGSSGGSSGSGGGGGGYNLGGGGFNFTPMSFGGSYQTNFTGGGGGGSGGYSGPTSGMPAFSQWAGPSNTGYGFTGRGISGYGM